MLEVAEEYIAAAEGDEGVEELDYLDITVLVAELAEEAVR